MAEGTPSSSGAGRRSHLHCLLFPELPVTRWPTRIPDRLGRLQPRDDILDPTLLQEIHAYQPEFPAPEEEAVLVVTTIGHQVPPMEEGVLSQVQPSHQRQTLLLHLPVPIRQNINSLHLSRINVDLHKAHNPLH